MPSIRGFFRSACGGEVEDFNRPLEEMLASFGVLTERGEATRAGMLFFGKDPQRFEHSAVLKAVAFQGNDLGDTRYLDSRDIEGTIPMMLDGGMAFLRCNLRRAQSAHGPGGGELEIPEAALKELLVNALIHFDLANHAAIRLLVFNDRVEIVNPGALHGGLKAEELELGISRCRNPVMASLAARMGLCRRLGLGIVSVLREGAQVRFNNQASAGQFKATVFRNAGTGKAVPRKVVRGSRGAWPAA